MSWIVDYVRHAEQQEAPEIFSIWTAVTTIAAALGRNVYINRRAGGVTRYVNYPGHLMTVLVAESGVKKSTALNPMSHYMRLLNRDIIADKSSVESFLDQMDPAKGGNPNAIIVEGELTSFISKASYLDPLVEVIIKLHDAQDDFKFKTRGGGQIVIPKPSLTMLAATTPESLGDRLPASAHGAGFMARIIFAYSKASDKVEDLSDVEDDDITPEQCQAAFDREQQLEKDLQRIATLAGPFTFEKDARKWFREFYSDWKNSPAGKGSGYASRKDDHLLRIAMCWAAAEMKMTLELGHLLAAHKLLARAEKDFDKAFAYIGTADYVRDRQRILDFIAAKGGQVSTTELMGAMYNFFKDSETLRRTLRLLTEAGILSNGMITVKGRAVETWSLAGVEFKT